MSRLVRAESHGNGVSVIYHPHTDTYRKVSRSLTGIGYISNEYAGTTWYAKRVWGSEHYLVRDYWDLVGYSRIDLRAIRGNIRSYHQPISENEKSIKDVLNHYFEVWEIGDRVPCHGDLTLDNIIFNKDGPCIFDWEHFQIDAVERGFDAVYLVLSAITLPYYPKMEFNKNDIRSFRHLWAFLEDKGAPLDALNSPYKYFQRIFNNSKFWRSTMEYSPRKLFPAWVCGEQEKAVLRLIHG